MLIEMGKGGCLIVIQARPGYSEHQSGLAFDLIDTEGNLLEEPGASQWL